LNTSKIKLKAISQLTHWQFLKANPLAKITKNYFPNQFFSSGNLLQD